jgi:hypothetical protein
MFHIDHRLAIAFCSPLQVASKLHMVSKGAHLIDGVQSAKVTGCKHKTFVLPGLKEIHAYYENIRNTESFRAGKTVVVCVGNHPEDITLNALMVGAFLILNDEWALDEVERLQAPS